LAISFSLAVSLTDAEILDLSERNPGLQIEQGAQLHRWAEVDGGGVVFSSSAGFRLPDGSLLSPDASWVRRDQQEGFTPFCPDAVFEILPTMTCSITCGRRCAHTSPTAPG